MRSLFAAAFVAHTQAENLYMFSDRTLTAEDMMAMTTGFLHGLGVSQDVKDCFNGEVGTELEAVVTLFMQSEDCQIESLDF